MKHAPITPVGYLGKRPYFKARIGTGPSTLVLIYGASRNMPSAFHVEQIIRFVEIEKVQGLRISYHNPPWKTGRIWDLNEDRLFIKRT